MWSPAGALDFTVHCRQAFPALLHGPGQALVLVEQVPLWHFWVDSVVPLHVTVLPHDVPSGLLLQVPIFPLRLQAWHTLVQAELQHTPSTQNPERQALLFPWQAVPLGRSMTHFPLTHWYPPVQSATDVHEVLQVDPVAQA
jgi:hypothetical protein